MSLLRYFKILTGSKGSTPEGAPTSTNIDANTQALDVFVKGGVSINTTGLATSAKQQQMISLLQQLVNCSCNTQPCGSNGYVQTILLA